MKFSCGTNTLYYYLEFIRFIEIMTLDYTYEELCCHLDIKESVFKDKYILGKYVMKNRHHLFVEILSIIVDIKSSFNDGFSASPLK